MRFPSKPPTPRTALLPASSVKGVSPNVTHRGAPPVYRPENATRALQSKALLRPPGLIQPIKSGIHLPAFQFNLSQGFLQARGRSLALESRPAPPVYQPRNAAAALQPKTPPRLPRIQPIIKRLNAQSKSLALERRPAPPVYRLEQSISPCVQPGHVGPYRFETRPASAVYRAPQSGASAQPTTPKRLIANRLLQPRTQYEPGQPLWPPIYRPFVNGAQGTQAKPGKLCNSSQDRLVAVPGMPPIQSTLQRFVVQCMEATEKNSAKFYKVVGHKDPLELEGALGILTSVFLKDEAQVKCPTDNVVALWKEYQEAKPTRRRFPHWN